MKTISRLISSLIAVAAMVLTPAASGQLPPVPEPRPVAPLGGLTLQLTTSAYKVVQPRATDPAAAVVNPTPQREAFAACALLANRTNSAITFTFPDGASAAAKFEFVLNDKDGNEVWRSDEGIGTAALTEATLKRGGVWKRLVRVPLIIEGVPLPVGNYTLLAFTDADKQVLAQTLLEVVARPADPARGKINGAVVKVITPATDTDPEVTEPVPGAWVTVQQLGDAAIGARLFSWSGHADDGGKFSVEVPAGRYRVTAGESVVVPLGAPAGVNVILPPPVYPPKSVEVNVAAGATVDVLIKLTKAPPPVAQGIRGLVVRPLPPEAASPLSEMPIAGAKVEINEILADVNPALGAPIRPPFHWTGTTNAEGRFEVRTPVGKFRIVATKVYFAEGNVPVVQVQVAQPGGVILPPPDVVLTASADVAVAAGKITDVKLSLQPAPAPVPVVR